ncbi:hypothetical protein ABW19_dt0206775 [Dactylella cylindrospora]|nr:hypothetical protein ABW19_dt0206775 [Dactylella cylindrospora]
MHSSTHSKARGPSLPSKRNFFYWCGAQPPCPSTLHLPLEAAKLLHTKGIDKSNRTILHPFYPGTLTCPSVYLTVSPQLEVALGRLMINNPVCDNVLSQLIDTVRYLMVSTRTQVFVRKLAPL